MNHALAAGAHKKSPGIVLILIIFAGVFAVFVALGVWQIERRAWKLDLIAQVEQRVHAAAIPAPDAAQWPQVNSAADEYRRVKAVGVFLNDRETLVQASTEFGSGFWVMTPLRTADGNIVLVNRGFVSSQERGPAARGSAAPAGRVAVVGLLRMSQPGGGFLRHNDAAAGRWFSRDTQAIAAAHGLQDVAPYFIDAGIDANTSGAANRHAQQWPIAGLTVISFPNNHLVYAITWFLLALLSVVGAAVTWRARREPPILREEKTRGECDDGNSR